MHDYHTTVVSAKAMISYLSLEWNCKMGAKELTASIPCKPTGGEKHAGKLREANSILCALQHWTGPDFQVQDALPYGLPM